MAPCCYLIPRPASSHKVLIFDFGRTFLLAVEIFRPRCWSSSVGSTSTHTSPRRRRPSPTRRRRTREHHFDPQTLVRVHPGTSRSAQHSALSSPVFYAVSSEHVARLVPWVPDGVRLSNCVVVNHPYGKSPTTVKALLYYDVASTMYTILPFLELFFCHQRASVRAPWGQN